MLEFFDVESSKGSVSIYENHITLSKSLLKYFNEAYRVRIGVDKEDNEVYIFSIDKDYALSGEIKESSMISISLSKTYARICSKALIDYLSNIFNLTINKKEYLRYDASYDEGKRAVVINMGGNK